MGRKRNNVIEINGRRYDAVTGELLNPAQIALVDAVKPAAGAPQQARHAAAAHAKPHPPIPSAAHSRTAKVMDIAAPRRHTHHTVRHQPQHGTTLMRHAVKRPAPPLKRHVSAVTPTDILVARTPALSVVPKWSYLQIDPRRLARADHIAKSKLIRRFAPPASEFTLSSRPIIAAPTPKPPIATGHPDRPMPSPTHRQAEPKPMDIFQRALKSANAHEQPPVNPAHRKHLRHLTKAAAAKRLEKSPRKFRHRTATLVSTAFAIVLLAGFIAYQNKTNLQLRVATAATGVHASLPTYKPSGFALGKLTYSPGTVAMAFSNSASDSSYKITQQNSNWDSATLLDSYVALKNDSYQTLQTGGRTVYVYGKNNASWVSGGIWYQITDNGSLSTNDVLNIASSM